MRLPAAKIIVTIIVFMTVCNNSFAQPGRLKGLVQKADSLIQMSLERIPVIPAIAISIVDENGPLLVKAYGWLDKEKSIRADENSLFYIASNTKAFVGLAAALLDRDKKILLDSSFKKYLPQTKFINDINNNITVRNLLTHTSGLENNPLVFHMTSGIAVEKDRTAWLLANSTVPKRPSGVYEYDNLGYNIYGLLLEASQGLKWQHLLHERVFKPLDMQRTTAYISTIEKNQWPMAVPYYGYGEKGLTKLEATKKDHTMQPAGGLMSTASDMAKWLQAQVNDGKVGNKQVFPAALMNATQTGYVSYERRINDSIVPAKYGLGWNQARYRNEEFIFHTGGYPGYQSAVSFMPARKIGVAIMTNESSIGTGIIDYISDFIYDWTIGVADAESIFLKKLELLENNHVRQTAGSQKSFADRAGRTSQLSLPLTAYTGKYHHDLYGDMEVRIENNSLGIYLGNIHSLSTPFTQKETVRVEFTPGKGEVISFKFDDAGKLTGLVYNKLEFRKN